MDREQLNDLCNLIDDFSISKPKLCQPELCRTHITTNKAITILTLNIRSINKNFDKLELLLQRLGLECDIIILTECWIHNNKPYPKLTNYNAAHTVNCINQNGGIVIYSKMLLRLDVEEPKLTDSNCLLIKIGNSTAIVALYRSPSFSNTEPFLNSLNSLLTNIKSYQNILLTGDLNINISESTVLKSKHTTSYLDLLASHGLLPSHNLPTWRNSCL